jgi:hypothetical protein
MRSKPSHRNGTDFDEQSFTVANLRRTSAHFRRINAAESKIAQVLEEVARDIQRRHERMPKDAQGPHLPPN